MQIYSINYNRLELVTKALKFCLETLKAEYEDAYIGDIRSGIEGRYVNFSINYVKDDAWFSDLGYIFTNSSETVFVAIPRNWVVDNKHMKGSDGSTYAIFGNGFITCVG